MPDADASGINQSPDEIDFVDIDGDGKADYVWTSKLDGRARVWYNQYPDKPTWLEGGEIAGGVGTSGANIRYATLQNTGRADYVAIEPKTGAFAAWLGGCGLFNDSPKNHKISIGDGWLGPGFKQRTWFVKQHPQDGSEVDNFCAYDGSQPIEDDVEAWEYPTAIWQIPKLFDHTCFYVGSGSRIGQLVCDGVSGARCYRDPEAGFGGSCDNDVTATRLIICEW